jgi:hypothetical protein
MVHCAFVIAVAPLRSCKQIYKDGFKVSGLYDVSADHSVFKVFCDMKHEGWTVILRRVDGTTDFNRNWDSYETGFGNVLNGNFFLGLENIRKLTSSGANELWIGIESHDISFSTSVNEFKKIFKAAYYNSFKLGPAESMYQLSISGYDSARSTAGDSLSNHNDAKFSTYDRDNDYDANDSCANKHKGGWWFTRGCRDSCLTGVWKEHGGNGKDIDGIVWETFKGEYYSHKTVIMAIRPKQS